MASCLIDSNSLIDQILSLTKYLQVIATQLRHLYDAPTCKPSIALYDPKLTQLLRVILYSIDFLATCSLEGLESKSGVFL